MKGVYIMRITGISNANSNNRVAFEAGLRVEPSALKAVKGEAELRFNQVMAGFRERLAKETLHHEDTVVVSKPLFRKAKINTDHGKEKANLKVAIDIHSVGFYYDKNRTIQQLVQDFMNTYEHLRYKAHYEPLPDVRSDSLEDFENIYRAMMP